MRRYSARPQETLSVKREEAESRPKPEFVPKSLLDLNLDGMGNDTESSGTPAHHRMAGASPLPSPMRSPAKSMASTPSRQQMTPYCQALYDFEPQNPGELGFKENEIVTLLSRVDDNWFEGSPTVALAIFHNHMCKL
ncbi:Endophilin-A [Eumeta japonica]|uniref:Endophilin-A n=1 Tax=Eumeta variegata TaxID=151549 RepID=A0A4C1SKG5_EUMVA|nr:Endophilin-A [Eumeta japonica]